MLAIGGVFHASDTYISTFWGSSRDQWQAYITYLKQNKLSTTSEIVRNITSQGEHTRRMQKAWQAFTKKQEEHLQRLSHQLSHLGDIQLASIKEEVRHRACHIDKHIALLALSIERALYGRYPFADWYAHEQVPQDLTSATRSTFYPLNTSYEHNKACNIYTIAYCLHSLKNMRKKMHEIGQQQDAYIERHRSRVANTVGHEIQRLRDYFLAIDSNDNCQFLTYENTYDDTLHTISSLPYILSHYDEACRGVRHVLYHVNGELPNEVGPIEGPDDDVHVDVSGSSYLDTCQVSHPSCFLQ